MNDPIKVLITGATGSIAYSLIPMVASGQVYGTDQPIILHLLGRRLSGLTGVVMELEDSVYPLIDRIVATDDEAVAFSGVDSVFMLASEPRRDAMLRKQLLAANVKVNSFLQNKLFG